MEKFKQLKFVKTVGFNRVVLTVVLLLMYFAFAILEPTFMQLSRIFSALNYAYFLGFLALGVTFVIATGGIDFSIGTVMFCSALIGGRLLTNSNVPIPVALIVCVMVGLGFGALNGIMVAYLGLPSFIASMASMMLSKGVGSVFTKTQSISWPQLSEGGWYKQLVIYKSGGISIPTGLICLIIASIICAIILNKMKAGRYMLCVGSNREALRLSGVDIRKWECLAYIICGVLAGFAAIFFVGAYSTVQPGMGDTYNNEAIASCVMGGTSMSGGLASISGTFIGIMVISLLQEGILAMGYQKDWQFVITGFIVIAAVYADVRSRRKRN